MRGTTCPAFLHHAKAESRPEFRAAHDHRASRAVHHSRVGTLVERMRSRLQDLRKNRFGSGQAMARAMGTSDAYVSQMLGATRGFDWLVRLEKACAKAGIDVDDLVRPDSEYVPGWTEMSDEDRDAIRALALILTRGSPEVRELLADYVKAAARRLRPATPAESEDSRT